MLKLGILICAVILSVQLGDPRWMWLLLLWLVV